jgi:hypothetical protein
MVLSKQRVDAEGKGVGEMFEYDVKQKITIGKNQSALVPILQSQIDVEKVTLLSLSGADSDDEADEKPGRALRCSLDHKLQRPHLGLWLLQYRGR